MDVYAVDLADPANNPLAKFSDLSVILNVVIPTLVIGSGVMFLGALLYGGFTIITAGGEPKNIQKAQSIMKYALIGLLIVVLSFLMMKMIEVVLNVDLPL